MDAEDQRVRRELMDQNLLGEGYHPRMEEVHRRNTARLKEIIAQQGWPGQELVGEDGAFAAWRIAQHSIGDPPFQRSTLLFLEDAASRGDVPAWHAAYLLDRIRMYEGKPQIYGTQFMPNEQGDTAPWEIEEPEHVDERRAAIGLKPLSEIFRQPDPAERISNEELKAWQRSYEEWLWKSGWR